MGLTVFVVLLLPAAALAQVVDSFSFDIPEQHIRAPIGSSHNLGTFNVPAALVGESCVVEAVADNNASVHTDNDFIVSSGGASITLPNVERGPGAVTTATEELTLGATINVTLFLGNVDNQNSGVFSGGFTITVTCTDEPEPSPSPTPTPPTTPPPSPSPSPSPSPEPSETESPRPPGEVESGGEVESETEAGEPGSLPFTGPAIAGPLLWAAGLLGAGFSALWVSRRK
jgi:hypothetical protein